MRFYYKCSECKKEFELDPALMLCPDCKQKQETQNPLRGILEVQFDGTLSSHQNLNELLPVESKYFPSVPVGNTPLWKPENLRKKYGLSELFIKDDTLNPSGSLKDRASFLVSAHAKKNGINNIVVASTGNAASSMSAIGAAAGQDITIFIPKAAPQAKMIQSLQYGARVVLVDGNYDKAFDISLEFSKLKGGLNRNTAYNPLTIEGKKTVALEIYQQLGKTPDVVFVPVGDGVILSGVYKGFIDLHKLGLISKIPVIYAVQAQGSNAICRAFTNRSFDFNSSHTVADSICVDVPRGGHLALKNLKEHQGQCVTVSDEDIIRAQKELSSSTGLFAEPAGATAFAGFLSAKKSLKPNVCVVLLVTGNGLKDLSSAMKSVQIPQSAIQSVQDI